MLKFIRPKFQSLAFRSLGNGFRNGLMVNAKCPGYKNLNILPSGVHHIRSDLTKKSLQYSILSFSGGKNEDPKPNNSRIGLITSFGLGASILFGKMKYVLVALKLTKAMPLASMVLSSFAYSFIFGWPYAIGMVSLIFVHECGHLIVMKYYKLPFSPMVFIPFMGAFIALKDSPRNSYQDAIIGFGGPVLGSAAAFGTALVGSYTDSQLLYALADWGYLINLFNLLPIGQMDGGRIGSAISPAIGLLGLAGGGAMIYYGTISNPIFYLIMLGGTYSTASRFMGWDSEDRPKDFYKISGPNQIGLFISYIALVAALMVAMKENNKKRKTPKQLSSQDNGDLTSQKDGVYDDFFPNDFSNDETEWK